MDDFSNITNTQDMIDYCKYSMAMPILNVELMDVHFRLAITDAALEYARYNNMDATYQEYCLLNLSANTSFYPVSACISLLDSLPVTNAQSVTDIQISSNLDGFNNLFTPSHLILVETGALYQPNGTAFGPIVSTMGNGNPLANYTTAMMYLKEITNLFSHSLSIRYISGKKMLQTVPSPVTSGPAIIQIMRSIKETEMYNFPSMRKLSLARCLIIYGRVLRKYNGNLPDGLSLNADAVFSEGSEMYKEAIAEIKSESPPCDFFVG
jgi:hypothetical protein